MEPAFWIGFFAMVTSVATALGAHIKNLSQDKAAAKRDLRINSLEVEVRLCHEERNRILEQLKNVRDKHV